MDAYGGVDTFFDFLESLPAARCLRCDGYVADSELQSCAAWCLAGLGSLGADQSEQFIAMVGRSLPESVCRLRQTGISDLQGLIEPCAEAFVRSTGDKLRQPAQRASALELLRLLSAAISDGRIRPCPTTG